VNALIKVIVGVILLILTATGALCAGIPDVKNMVPNIAVPGELIKVSGENFNNTVKVVLKYSAVGTERSVTITPESVEKNTTLTFKVPMMEGSSKVSLFLRTGETDYDSKQTLCIYSNKYIREAINWKTNGMTDTAILEHIAKMLQDETDSGNNSFKLFTGIPIIGDELGQLREAKFSEDFISKLEGQKQYVTFGITAVLLAKTSDLVAAPMARIFIVPKSYFKTRVPFFNTHYTFREWIAGVLERTDLNVGYTVIKSKVSDTANTSSGNDKDTNYILVGGSYEINKAALFNIGWGIPVNVPDKKKGQLYFGVTVDYNILKALNIVN
jgi:hypothetical protein